MMFYFLILAAVVLFVTHVALLFTAFPHAQLSRRRYFYSHLTLWLTGAVIFLLAPGYGGSGRSAFLDYFDSPLKLALIMAFTFTLSLVAHIIVRLAVLPLLEKSS